MSRRAWLGALVLVLCAPAARAGTPITIGETVKIASKVLGEERTVLITTPAEYDRTKRRFPVLYLTDGEAQLGHTRGTVEFLARNGLVPNMIIVAVTNTDRTRDLTPTHLERWADENGTVHALPTSGGADRFLDFFEKELIPYVEASYRTEPYRIFCGHSFGGLFAVHAFLTRPELFNAVVAVSGTYFWGDDVEQKKAEAFFTGRPALKRTLFLTVGSEGERMKTSTEKLANVFASARATGFRFDWMTFPDENHGSVVLRSHYHALRKIFEGWRMPLDEVGNYRQGLDEVKKHYEAVSERLGWKVQPPEAVVNMAGYHALGRKETKKALELLRWNAETYPDSPNVYDSLGDALEADGQLDAALASFRKGAERGEKAGDPSAAVYKKNVDRLEKEIAQKGAPSK